MNRRSVLRWLGLAPVAAPAVVAAASIASGGRFAIEAQSFVVAETHLGRTAPFTFDSESGRLEVPALNVAGRRLTTVEQRITSAEAHITMLAASLQG